MRLSLTQKAVLISLYAIAQRGQTNKPVPAMTLLKIINLQRERTEARCIADTNFRTSCHTLEKNGLLNKSRDMRSLQLYFSLTAAGKETAKKLYLMELKLNTKD